MALTDTFINIVSCSKHAHRGDQPELNGHARGSHEHYVFLEMLALKREFSPAMARAMLEAEWPESMSATEQMAVMFKAAIDALLEEPTMDLIKRAERFEQLVDAIDYANTVRSHGLPKDDPKRVNAMAGAYNALELLVMEIIDRTSMVVPADHD